jgi:ribonuclease HI
MITIYTDGSYNHPKRLCGSAFIAINNFGKIIKQEVKKYEAKTTSWNIESEIVAVHMALDFIEKEKIKNVHFCCDLKNCVNHINGSWRGKQEQSRNLYIRVKNLKTNGYKITVEHVKGHSGNFLNDLVDNLCRV